MVDVSNKSNTDRLAVAVAKVRICPELLLQFEKNTLSKGDAFSTARLAGIQAAKKTPDLIPLCHTLPLTSISVDLKLKKKPPSVEIVAEARSNYKTGVEMEALTAASIAALTIYDMGKAVDRGMTIECIRLIEKKGGRSGHFRRKDPD